MKKPYSKPWVVHESFEFTANIAAGCEVQSHNNAAQGTCGVVIPIHGMSPVFTYGITGCTKKLNSADTIATSKGQLCYFMHSDSYNLFNS